MKISILMGIFLSRHEEIISKSDLVKEMNLSESYIRQLVREANLEGEKNGFKIKLIKGKGYFLEILDSQLFDSYVKETSNEVDLYNAEERINLILFNILQAQGFFTYEELANKLALSKTTIIRDLKKVGKLLEQDNLAIESKAHYGLRVVGDEKDYRKVFSKYVLSSELFFEPAQHFNQFRQDFDKEILRKKVKESIQSNKLNMSDIAFENIINHIVILVYRVKNRKIVTDTNIELPSDSVYDHFSKDLSNWIATSYDIELPKSEINLLALHISGKSMVSRLDEDNSKELKDIILTISNQIDKEFLTELSEDSELQESLLLHIFPLINRVYNNFVLDNPIIDDIYKKYTNVFLLAIRFSELLESQFDFNLSRDEIGYLSLHFAAHIERAKQKKMSKLKRIVVVCSTGGGSSQLLKLKLEDAFPNAIILTSSSYDIDRFKYEQPDLILTTVPINHSFTDVPVIKITQWLTDSDMNQIKKNLTFYSDENSFELKEIFTEQFFYQVKTNDYMKLLEELSKDAINLGYAPQDFDQDVLDRERKFSTIYGNGIAGPHALKLNAIKNSVSVAIFEEPIEFEGKTVKIVFLINLQKGYLFLHKEMSKLLLYLMENKAALRALTQAKNFKQFKLELDAIMNN